MKRSIIASTIVHALVFVGILLMPRSPAKWDRVNAIPVDLVGPLRQKASSAAPPAAAPAEQPQEPKVQPPQEAPAEKKEPTAPKEPKEPAPKREAPRRYQPIAPPSSNEPSLEERLRQRLGEVEGNEGEGAPAETTLTAPTPQPPGVGTGDSPASTAEVSATDFPYAWYLNLLRTKISDAWDPPASRLLSGRANQVIIRFVLARTGGVSNVDVEVVSGAPGLESSALRAVDRAQPFPPLPDGYPDDSVDIAVRFTVSEGRR